MVAGGGVQVGVGRVGGDAGLGESLDGAAGIPAGVQVLGRLEEQGVVRHDQVRPDALGSFHRGERRVHRHQHAGARAIGIPELHAAVVPACRIGERRQGFEVGEDVTDAHGLSISAWRQR
ncbi:hypothetical protein D3C87_1579530 [compost metagenome]